MDKKTLLNDPNVIKFIEFVAEKWEKGLNFEVGIKHKGRSAEYKHTSNLKEILNTYFWQYSINTELDFPEEFKRGFELQESENVLNFCKEKLIKNGSINPNLIELRAGTEIVLRWGGVFTKGNKQKATNIFYDLKKDYEEVVQKWNEINLKNAEFSPNAEFGFTSNAGFTKVYSLLLSDFIIYDSRVSVALAYLIEMCFGESIPEILRIYIPASKVVDKTKRKVNSSFKPTYQQDSKHFYSNVISSLLLSESLKLIQKKDHSLKLRDLEAALFMMGYDVSEDIEEVLEDESKEDDFWSSFINKKEPKKDIFEPSYLQKVEQLFELIEQFVTFPSNQLLIIYGETKNKEIEINHCISKIKAKEIVDIRTTIDSEEKLFNILSENNGKILLIRWFWSPTLLENKATQMLRDAIGWTLDGDKWNPIIYKGKKLNFTGKIILESNLSELKSKKIKKTGILRDSHSYKFELTQEEKYFRNS